MGNDVQIQHAIHVQLRSALPTLFTAIGVEVHGGVVTLTGRAHNDEEREAAERAAQRVAGVLALDDEIAITPA